MKKIYKNKENNFDSLNNQIVMKGISMVVLTSMIMTLSSCEISKKHSEDKFSETSSEFSQTEVSEDVTSSIDTVNTSESSIESATSSETVTPTKNPNPSEYSDYLDVAVPREHPIDLLTMNYNGNDINIFTESGALNLLNFGFDNPYLLKNIREAIGDDSITCYDIDYFQSVAPYIMSFEMPYDNYLDPEYNVGGDMSMFVFNMDLARYILEENGLRFWVDEIGPEFFEQKVGDIYEQAITSSCDEYLNLFPELMNFYTGDKKFKGLSSIPYEKGSDEYNKLIKQMFFNAAGEYNTYRRLIIFDLKAKQIKNTEGYNVIRFDQEYIYNKVRNDYKKISGYDVDPIHNGVESREDIGNNNIFNISIDEFDEMSEVIGGVKYEKTNSYDTSRTRQG